MISSFSGRRDTDCMRCGGASANVNAEEIGHNVGTAGLRVVGDIKLVVLQLLQHFDGRRWDASPVLF